MVNLLTKSIIKSAAKLTPIAIGTKFFPTNSLETEYVELFNYTQTILFELEKAEITSDTILQNLVRDVGAENLPDNYTFHELKPAENKIEEYALVSNIIMGSDRYFYIELPNMTAKKVVSMKKAIRPSTAKGAPKISPTIQVGALTPFRHTSILKSSGRPTSLPRASRPASTSTRGIEDRKSVV